MQEHKFSQQGSVNLPPIPQKRYFTIGEVSQICEVKPHVLRYWEQEFNQLKPSKRRGNRRYYQYKDVLMIRQIKSLLYERGFTINGARQHLTGDVKEVNNLKQTKPVIRETIKELEGILETLMQG